MGLRLWFVNIGLCYLLECEVDRNMAIYTNETQYPICSAVISSVFEPQRDLWPCSIHKYQETREINCNNTLV